MGIAATFAQYALAPHSNVLNVGASGAIAGVLGAYILMFPQARVRVLLGQQIVAMPAIVVLGMWIELQLFSGVGSIARTDESANMGGVAYMAAASYHRLPADVLVSGSRHTEPLHMKPTLAAQRRGCTILSVGLICDLNKVDRAGVRRSTPKF